VPTFDDQSDIDDGGSRVTRSGLRLFTEGFDRLDLKEARTLLDELAV
jgi:hypothetical protein